MHTQKKMFTEKKKEVTAQTSVLYIMSNKCLNLFTPEESIPALNTDTSSSINKCI
jgi:hypothetical protein